MKELFERLITPLGVFKRDGIQYWQDRILLLLLAITVVLGFFVYVPSVALSIREELWIVVAADTLIYAWAIILFARKSLPFKLRAYSTILLSYVLAIVLLLTIGPFGAGPVWLFFFPVITGLFLNLRATIVSLAINAITIILLGLAIYFDYMNWRRSAGFPFEAWIVIGVNFIFLNTLAAVAIVSVLNGLQSSLLLEKEALASVEQKNLELEESNLKLQKVINDRKKVQQALDKSERALEESELMFQDLVNLLPLSYFLIDTELNLKYINFKTLEIFNLPNQKSDRQFPKCATELLIPSDRTEAQAAIFALIENQDTGWEQYTGLRTDGGQFPMEVLASCVSINDKIVGVQGIVLDITERIENEKIRKAKEIAEETNKAISEWVGYIVHELRTPISSLLQFAQLGLKKLNDGDFYYLIKDLEPNLPASLVDQQNQQPIVGKYEILKDQLEAREQRLTKYFDRVHSSGFRLQRMLNELLDLSKLEAGKMQFSMRQADVLKVIQEACDEMEATTESRDLVIEIQQTQATTKMVCDPFRLGQVMRNLLNNSVKFSKPGTKISVLFQTTSIRQGRESNPALQVTVSDQGIGIPHDQIGLVFDKFRQSRKTRTGEGSGLGLPICRHIITAHNGSIWAESDEDRGTKVHFTLPYTNQAGIGS